MGSSCDYETHAQSLRALATPEFARGQTRQKFTSSDWQSRLSQNKQATGHPR
jgi:hypothetical protein